ncbi:helix-turn-helix transcriptional regulator [Streptomyces cinnabarinus]|uniref:Helix-turn-helix transcriptional regulator n=1 Tax=Streptomyces cinnabarinus TaxID=67287 RepID=A0ABY7K6X3_9ACTN|nr:helix-turn-helix domain-containing protein [Streptomyces cinnabarinus]WAZ20250.1 helix-turn-helix transcriptional regulator [Streptomyces cinnabarinus]
MPVFPPLTEVADSTGTPGPEIAEALSALLRRYRTSRAPLDAHRAADALGVDPPPVQYLPGKLRAAGLTQEQLSALLHVSARAYGAWERGTAAIRPEIVAALAAVLGMPEADRAVLHRLALHQDPPPVPAPPDGSLVDPMWRMMVHLQPYPAYVCTTAWDILVANRAYYDCFPFVAPASADAEANIVRSALLRPEAQDVLVNWAQDWAEPVLRQVWSTYQLHPANERLAALIRDVARHPTTRELWERRETSSTTYPDTVERALRHPQWGETAVVNLAATPESLRLAGFRFVALLPAHLKGDLEELEASVAAMGG